MARIRNTNQLNGRFRNYLKKDNCNCNSNKLQPYTDNITPINGILENILGNPDSTITTVGVKIDSSSIVKLSAGVIIAGLVIKNLKIK